MDAAKVKSEQSEMAIDGPTKATGIADTIILDTGSRPDEKSAEAAASSNQPSAAAVPQPVTAATTRDTAAIDAPRTYKSWRKKYRKMKEHFDKKMETSISLYIAEHKAKETAKRIREQNDQLLDLLLDLNEVADKSIMFSLNLPTDDPNRSTTPTSMSNGVENPHHRLSQLVDSTTHTPLNMPDTKTLPEDLRPPPTGDDMSLPAYLTGDEEFDYLERLDQLAATLPSALPSSGAELILPPHIMGPKIKQPVTENDFAVHHPISVHNWLRKHQPHIFAGAELGKDAGGGGAGAGDEMWGAPRRKTPPPSRRSKKDKERIAERERRAEAERKERVGSEEAGDDESVFAGEEAGDAFGSSRGRRRRDDDTYRPKGGTSRAAKRKRDSLDASVGSIKKAKKLEPATPASAVFAATAGGGPGSESK